MEPRLSVSSVFNDGVADGLAGAVRRGMRGMVLVGELGGGGALSRQRRAGPDRVCHLVDLSFAGILYGVGSPWLDRFCGADADVV